MNDSSPGQNLKNFVGGQFVGSDALFDNVNPVDGSLVAHVHEADRNLVDRAVEAAHKALEGDWGRMALADRCSLLHDVANGIEARFDDFLEAEVADTGKSYPQARGIDIPRGVANFRFFADMVKSVGSECFETDTPDGRGALNYALRKPLGVVAVVSPWNLPLLLLTWKVAPAMAAGNAIIAKPSEETPSTATLLAEVMQSTGMPDGAFNLVHGFGPNSAGEFLTSHPDVDAITFTGESATGMAIMRAAAENVKPISFELGGKNAAIVFEDADFDEAVAGVARSSFTNCGQVCLCSERVYVARPIFDRFVAALKVEAEKIKIGRPADDGVTMGPLVSREHREKVLSYYKLAEEEGATVITGGAVPEFGDERDGGAFIEPTIWIDMSEDARCIKEEVFGPVCHIAPFDTEEEAVALANDTKYGLAAAIWTTDLQRAHRVAKQMEVGITWVNTWFLRDLRTPFGGVGLSGIGREGGIHSLDFYTEPANICIKL